MIIFTYKKYYTNLELDSYKEDEIPEDVEFTNINF